MSSAKCRSREEKWNAVIAEAHKKLLKGREYVAKIKAAIRVLERRKAEGEPWPGDSSQAPNGDAATHNYPTTEIFMQNTALR
jgi:hypothetical protein